MFAALTEGLKYLHQKNIVHRDIKLENIFCTENNKVKIGDLGMSKIIYRDTDMISTRVGTPIYFAPEVIQHQMYSFPVDVWALGCTFYYLATLEHPFKEATI
jgi:serine/threonine protein kinase